MIKIVPDTTNELFTLVLYSECTVMRAFADYMEQVGAINPQEIVLVFNPLIDCWVASYRGPDGPLFVRLRRES